MFEIEYLLNKFFSRRQFFPPLRMIIQLEKGSIILNFSSEKRGILYISQIPLFPFLPLW